MKPLDVLAAAHESRVCLFQLLFLTNSAAEESTSRSHPPTPCRRELEIGDDARPSDVRLPHRPAKPRHSRVLPTAAAPRGEGNPRSEDLCVSTAVFERDGRMDGRLPSVARGQERDGGVLFVLGGLEDNVSGLGCTNNTHPLPPSCQTGITWVHPLFSAFSFSLLPVCIY